MEPDRVMLNFYGYLSPKAKSILPKIASLQPHGFKIRERAGYCLVILEGGSFGERDPGERKRLQTALNELEEGGLIKRTGGQRFDVTAIGLRIADLLK